MLKITPFTADESVLASTKDPLEEKSAAHPSVAISKEKKSLARDVASKTTNLNLNSSSSTGGLKNEPLSHGGFSKTFSIKEAMNGGINLNSTKQKTTSGSKQQVSIGKKDLKDAFTDVDVESKLKEFVKVKRTNEQVRCALTAHKPMVKDNTHVVIYLNNTIQEDEIKRMKSEILNFLKRELRNSQILLSTKIVETQSGKKIYTDTDRFNYLNDKNPVLGLLKQKFSLDFD